MFKYIHIQIIFIIINIFSIELFLFVEKGMMILSILFVILAVEQFINYLQNHKIKNIILSTAFIILNNFTYQGTLALFTLLGSLYIILNSKNIKEFIKNNFIMFSIYGIPTLISRIFITTPRIKSTINFTEKIYKFFSY